MIVLPKNPPYLLMPERKNSKNLYWSQTSMVDLEWALNHCLRRWPKTVKQVLQLEEKML